MIGLSLLPHVAVPTIRTHTPGCAENSHRPCGHFISGNTGEDGSVNGHTHGGPKTSIAQEFGDRYQSARIARVHESYRLGVSKTHGRIRYAGHQTELRPGQQ